jgi:hypothetical protein
MTAAVFFKALKPANPRKAPIKEQGAGSPFSGLTSILADHKVGSKFGPEKVKEGHDVTFKAGTFVGSGKVRATGRHGCAVEDEEARSHDIRWHEITGHTETEGDEKSGKKGDAQK